MKSMFMVVLIISVVVGIAILAGLAVFRIQQQRPLSISSSQGILAKTSRYPAKDITEITLSFAQDSIEFLQSPDDTLVIEEYLPENMQNETATHTVSQGHLKVISERQTQQFNVLGGLQYKCIVYLPASWQGGIHAVTTSGNMVIEPLWEFAYLTLESSSGSQWVSNAIVRGDATFTSSSGSIKLGDISSLNGSLTVDSSSGRLRGAALVSAANITLRHTSGTTQVERLQAQGTINLQYSSGSVTLGEVMASHYLSLGSSGSQTIERITGEVTMSTTSGSLRVGETIGHGAMSATSGSIRWDIDQLQGDVAMSTVSGSSTLSLPKDVQAKVTMITTTGGLRSDFPWVTKQEGNLFEGSVGQAIEKLPQVTLTATSGSLRLEER